MTTFNTGNPVPSTDSRDLSDNAETIDNLVNSTSDSTPTRLGKSIITVKGLENQYVFTAINGGIWAAGQIFTAFNQYMVFSGTAYKPKNTTTLPYVVGATPDNSFVEVVGNSSTAQIINDLSQAYEVKTVDELRLLSGMPDGKVVEWNDYYSTRSGGGNSGVVKTGAHTDDGGSIFTLADGKYVEANQDGNRVEVTKFGAIPDDTTDVILRLEAATLFAGLERTIWLSASGDIPSKSYMISRPWRAESNYSVNGENITIKPLVGFTGIVYNDVAGGNVPVTLDYLMQWIRTDNIRDASGPLRKKADIGSGINLDCLNIAKGGLYIERMPYSNIGCNVYNCLGGNDHGIYLGFFCWGAKINNPNIESYNGGAIFVDDGCNGIEIDVPNIWGNLTTPPAGITINLNCNGVVINGGFIEKMNTGLKTLTRVGGVTVIGTDFEGITNRCVDAFGDLTAPTGRITGPIKLIGCFLGSTNEAVFADNARVIVSGCRIATLTTNFVTANNGTIEDNNNEKVLIDGTATNARVITRNHRTSIYSVKNRNPYAGSGLFPSYELLNYQVTDFSSPTSGLNFKTDFSGGALDRYVSQSTWFITENRNQAEFKEVGVRLNNDAGQSVFEPTTTNTILCGSATEAWAGGNTQVAFTILSDERHKTEILSLSDKEKAVALEIKANLGKYKLLSSVEEKGEDGARWHFGAGAQTIKSIFEKHGLDGFRYGFLCYDEWDERLERKDDSEEPDKVTTTYRADGNRYGVRYEELFAMILAAI